MKTSSAKSKGRRLQQQVRDEILSLFPQLEEDDVKSAPMGVNGADIQLSPTARKLFPYSIECKNQETTQIWKWLKQATDNIKKGTYPALIFKRNRSKTYIVLEFDDFIKIIKK